MSELATMSCEACHESAPVATPEEIEMYMPAIPEWNIVDVDGVRHLRREFSFDDFASALAFADRVGVIADEEGHHPSITVEWGRATVDWWTHKIDDLHANDFIMAAKTDSVE